MLPLTTVYSLLPHSLFATDKDRVQRALQKEKVKICPVGDREGIQVKCGSVECIFEFEVYRFKGEYTPPDNIPPWSPGFPPPRPPMPGMAPGGLTKPGSIALILPADMFPQLDASVIEQFFAGQSAIELSAQGSNAPIRFILKDCPLNELGGPSVPHPRVPTMPFPPYRPPVHMPPNHPAAQGFTSAATVRPHDAMPKDNQMWAALNREQRENRPAPDPANRGAARRIEVAAEVYDRGHSIPSSTSAPQNEYSQSAHTVDQHEDNDGTFI